jgi:membrane-associated phospholipid phosphatase
MMPRSAGIPISGSVANDENAVSNALPWALAGALLAGLAGFLTLAFVMSRHPSLSSFDYRFLTDVTGQRSPWLTVAARGVTKLGTELVLYPLLAAAGGLHWWRRGRAWPGIAALVWLWLGQAARLSISQQIARPRPPQALRLVDAGGYSFPSGHTTSATIGYALLAVLVIRLLPANRRLLRSLPVVLAVSAAVAVGFSRVYLGVHWPSDVAAGWSLAVAWLALGGLAIAFISRRNSALAALWSDAATNRGTSE